MEKLIFNEDLPEEEVNEVDERKFQVLVKRLSTAIVLLIKENPLLPFSFVFNGVDILQQLKDERYSYKQKMMSKLKDRSHSRGLDEITEEVSPQKEAALPPARIH